MTNYQKCQYGHCQRIQLKKEIEQLEAKWKKKNDDFQAAEAEIEQLEDVIKALRKGPRQIDMSSCEARVKELEGERKHFVDDCQSMSNRIEQIQARNKEVEEWVILRCNELGDQIVKRDKTIEKLEAEPERIARTIMGIKWLGQWNKRMILTELYPPPEKDDE